MSEADKIIKNLKNSGKKVEEFYMSNKGSDKNVVNIEDIIVLKNIEKLKRIEFKHFVTDRELKALEHILAEREQDKKRIQELEEQVKMLDEAYTGTIKESKKWFDIAHNSIPKQVVIDKIKEYDKKMEEDAGHPNWVVTDRIVMNVLQELLETK